MAKVPEQFKQTHLALSKMKQFHSDGKYWDVQIRVDEEVFKCQRSLLAAHSEYFDTMFSSSNFVESNAKADQPITLREMDATAFEELLNFMYTGEICVKDSNVLQLLVMNDFLQLYTGLVKERCLEHVIISHTEKKKPMLYALDLLFFTFLKGETVFVDILNAHICRHLYHYSKDAQLMEISFENLNALLKLSKDYIGEFRGSADVPLKIIHNWINHNRAGRSQYRRNLMENIDFANVSANFSRSLMNRLDKAAEVVNLSEDIDSLSELKTLVKRIDTNLTDGDVQLEGVISHNFKNVPVMPIDERLFSPSYIISGLSWHIGIKHTNNDGLAMYLYCYGTDVRSIWSCYANAIFTIVSHKDGREDYVAKFNRQLFSSDKNGHGWGPLPYVKWEDVVNPENGYIDDDGSLSLNVHVYVDIPFPKWM